MHMGTDKRKFEVEMPRAPRFQVRIRLSYRTLGEEAWHEGWTENISRSGVLFRVNKPLLPRTQVEMSLRLPVAIAGESSADVLCKGQIVRVREPLTVEDHHALAATIQEYRFLRGGEQIR